jgi:hypothetical protein
MKYIKSILVIAITASIAGFVVWHLMWMTGIEKKFKEELSSGVINKVEVRESISEGRKGDTEKNRQAGEGKNMSLKEGGTQISQTGTAQQETEKQQSSKDDSGTKLPVEETKPESVKEGAKWFEKDINLGKKQQAVKPVPGKTTAGISDDKPMPVSINNQAKPLIQKSIQQPQPIQRPDVKITGVTPSPTSTRP